MKTIRTTGLLALAGPLLALPLLAFPQGGLARPALAVVDAAAKPLAEGSHFDEEVTPVPCRCGPSLLLFGPFGCKCPFDLLVSALKPGPCTDAKGEPPCSPLARCSVSLRLWWVGEDEGCETPPKPLFAPMKASCGSFGTQVFFCPAGPGLVTAFLLCKSCKP